MLDVDRLGPVALADRARIEELYRGYGHGDSAHAFASLYLWHADMGLSALVADGVYTVLCRWRGENAWFFPVGADEAKAACLHKLLAAGCDRLCYMTEADAAFLERVLPGAFDVRPADGDSEYLYDRREMIDMPGRRFMKIRNLCRKLEREHAITAEPIREATLPLVRHVAEEWHPRSAGEEGIRDVGFMTCLFDGWSALGLQGVMLRLDGEPWAVAAGYPLGETDFDCCLMKARENLSGVAEQLRMALACSLDDRTLRVNFEEDLNLEGLRRMKSRFRPCGKIQMFLGERR